MVDKLSCADLDESTAYIDKFSRGRFSDPEATEKTLQVMPGLPKTVNDSVKQTMSVSITLMRVLGK